MRPGPPHRTSVVLAACGRLRCSPMWVRPSSHCTDCSVTCLMKLIPHTSRPSPRACCVQLRAGAQMLSKVESKRVPRQQIQLKIVDCTEKDMRQQENLRRTVN